MKKRDFRSLWIQRISAAVQQYGMNYSRCVRASLPRTMKAPKGFISTSEREPAPRTPLPLSSIFLYSILGPTRFPRRFIPGLRRASIAMDRKVLADLAVTEPYSFKAVVETVRSAAAAATTTTSR